MTNENLKNLIEDFSLFDDWEARYSYLIDLGKQLPAMDDALKTPQTLVPGCTSQVWMHGRISEEGRLDFLADSDAHIVRGLIAVLHKVYNDQDVETIQNTDIETGFKQIGLDRHLSPNRRNGFFSIVEKIKTMAACA